MAIQNTERTIQKKPNKKPSSPNFGLCAGTKLEFSTLLNPANLGEFYLFGNKKLFQQN